MSNRTRECPSRRDSGYTPNAGRRRGHRRAGRRRPLSVQVLRCHSLIPHVVSPSGSVPVTTFVPSARVCIPLCIGGRPRWFNVWRWITRWSSAESGKPLLQSVDLRTEVVQLSVGCGQPATGVAVRDSQDHDSPHDRKKDDESDNCAGCTGFCATDRGGDRMRNDVHRDSVEGLPTVSRLAGTGCHQAPP